MKPHQTFSALALLTCLGVPLGAETTMMLPINVLLDDCGFVGIDHTFPAPNAEGSYLLTVVEHMDTFDGAPYHFSSIGVYDCRSSKAISSYWDRTETALEVIATLRESKVNFSNWSEIIANTASVESVDYALGNGQAECGCLLHYGIEVSQ